MKQFVLGSTYDFSPQNQNLKTQNVYGNRESLFFLPYACLKRFSSFKQAKKSRMSCFACKSTGNVIYVLSFGDAGKEVYLNSHLS